jgi:hypothetical protein
MLCSWVHTTYACTMKSELQELSLASRTMIMTGKRKLASRMPKWLTLITRNNFHRFHSKGKKRSSRWCWAKRTSRAFRKPRTKSSIRNLSSMASGTSICLQINLQNRHNKWKRRKMLKKRKQPNKKNSWSFGKAVRWKAAKRKNSSMCETHHMTHPMKSFKSQRK